MNEHILRKKECGYVGVYHYKARTCHPALVPAGLGRFMQPDPIGYLDGPNRYAYAGNDPVNRIDPSGLYQCEIHGGLGRSIIGPCEGDGSGGGGGGRGLSPFDFDRGSAQDRNGRGGGGGGRPERAIADIVDRALEAACDLVGNDIFQATFSGAVGGAVSGAVLGGGVPGAVVGGLAGAAVGAVTQVLQNRLGPSRTLTAAIEGAIAFVTGGKAAGAVGGVVGGGVGGVAGGLAGGAVGGGVQGIADAYFDRRPTPFPSVAREAFTRGLEGTVKGGIARLVGAGAGAATAFLLELGSAQCRR